MPSIPKVAIACQGGGSHAASAAGLLLELLSPGMRTRFDLVALSGTSGGAMCASLVWSGLLRGGADDARARLEGFWRDVEVHDLTDAAINFWGLWVARLPVTADISPYDYNPQAAATLSRLLEKHLDLHSLTPNMRQGPLELIVGATDVQSGDRMIFHGERLTYDQLIASAAVPPIFRAVHTDHRIYWDGIFSANPPVAELTSLANKPDEIWVVQINPQRREGEPRTMREIVDRRNELSGNLSLGQELGYINQINGLLKKHPSLVESGYKQIKIRVVDLGLGYLDYPSKMDRSAAFIERLIIHGRSHAEAFFNSNSDWPRHGCVPAKPVHA